MPKSNVNLITVSKDPDAKKPIILNWQNFLVKRNNDTISSVTWSVPAGLTSVSVSKSGDYRAVLVVSGGTLGENYETVCSITTTGTMVYVRRVIIKCEKE